jgi:Chaperone of endosialidase
MSVIGPNNYNNISNFLSNDLHIDGSNSMLGNINMNNNKITNLLDPTNNKDAATKNYCDINTLTAENNCLSLYGTNVMETDLDINNHKIVNLSDPVNNHDAATKNYIDTKYNNSNIFIGDLSGKAITTGINNISLGYQSFQNASSGNANVAIGPSALTNITTGSNNVGIGSNALSQNVSGTNNTVIGVSSFSNNHAGNDNVIIGYNAASNYTGSETNNIVLGSGTAGATGETNTIRLGNKLTNKCITRGIFGITSTGGIPVYVNNGAQLGTVTSSIRFKENINDAKKYDINNFRVVNFNYIDDETKSRQVGLIAEEVEKLYPELVVYDESNQPYSVKYMELIPILLQKVQELEYRLNL